MRSRGDSKCRFVRIVLLTTSFGVTGVRGGYELTSEEEEAMDEVLIGATVGLLRELLEEKGKVSPSVDAEAVIGVLGRAIALAAIKAANKYS